RRQRPQLARHRLHLAPQRHLALEQRLTCAPVLRRLVREGHTHGFLLTSLAHPVLYAQGCFRQRLLPLLRCRTGRADFDVPDSRKLEAVGGERFGVAGFRLGSSARSPRRRASRVSGGGSEFILTTFPVIVTTAVGFVLNRDYGDLSKGAAEVGRADAGRLA